MKTERGVALHGVTLSKSGEQQKVAWQYARCLYMRSHFSIYHDIDGGTRRGRNNATQAKSHVTGWYKNNA